MQEEEDPDRGPESLPVAKGDKVFSDTNQGWGALTEQRNPILSENPFVYRFVERDNRGPGNFEFSTGV